jgi:hypothetical protein
MEQPARRKRDPRQDYDSRMSVTLSTIQELSLEEGDEGRHDEAEFKITTNIKALVSILQIFATNTIMWTQDIYLNNSLWLGSQGW